MVTPLLLMVVVRTTAWRWVPNFWMTTPFRTGHGSRPLLAVKLAARALASGVSAKLTFLVPAFLLEAAMASRIKRSISLSIFAVWRCFFLICAAYLLSFERRFWITFSCFLRSCWNCACTFRLSANNSSFTAFCALKVSMTSRKVSVFLAMFSPCCLR